MLRPVPRALQTLFLDLAEKVASATPHGSIYLHRARGTDYAYLRRRIGSQRTDEYIGRADAPATEQRIKLASQSADAAKERKRTVQLLKRGGLAAPDRLLGALLHTVADAHLFDGGAVLVGTAAYMMMEPLVAAFLPSPTLMTEDLDIATATLSLTADPPEAILPILQRADPTFTSVLQIDARRPPSRFRNAEGYLVDLVTPTLRRSDENPMPLTALQAGAAPLPYMRWLIDDPVNTVALWADGVGVTVPQPARYAVHKLILAQKRFAGSRAKRGKDLLQAGSLIEALRVSDPFALEDALDDARGQGKQGWADPIARSLIELGIEA